MRVGGGSKNQGVHEAHTQALCRPDPGDPGGEESDALGRAVVSLDVRVVLALDQRVRTRTMRTCVRRWQSLTRTHQRRQPMRGIGGGLALA